MATDWKTYAKAAARTAAKQAPDARKAAGRAAARGVVAAEKSAKQFRDGAAPAAKKRTEEAKRTAVAAAKVTEQRAKQATLGTRVKHAVRDISMIVFSLLVVYVVIHALGVPVPIELFVVVGVLIVLARVIMIFTRQSSKDAAVQAEVKRDREEYEDALAAARQERRRRERAKR